MCVPRATIDDTGRRSERARRTHECVQMTHECVCKTHEYLHGHSKWIFGRSRAFTNNPGWQASRTLPS